MKSVLILVMSAQRAPWGQLMDASMQTWDSIEHPDTQTIYYCGHKDRGGEFRRVIYAPISESLANLGHRTLHAYVHALTIPGWDYAARVNSSCYVHKRNLVEYVQDKPDKKVFCGLLGDSNVGFKYLWGGGQYILSRDVVEAMVANCGKWNHDMMEDVAATRLALDLGIPLDGSGRMCSIERNKSDFTCLCYGAGESFMFSEWDDINKAEGQFFFRVKHDQNRALDLENMSLLFKHLKQ